MGAALAAADLVVSRAGASILGEYPLFGLPAILVPYPYAWRYQKVNADYLVKRQAAEMLPDEQLKEKLLPTMLGAAPGPNQIRGRCDRPFQPWQSLQRLRRLPTWRLSWRQIRPPGKDISMVSLNILFWMLVVLFGHDRFDARLGQGNAGHL